MFIDKNKKRINIFAPYNTEEIVGIDLSDPANRAIFGVEEVPDPVAPEDFSTDTYFMIEQDEAPYVIYIRKTDEQIEQARVAQADQSREAAYKSESDPLFFKEQRGEVPQGTWIAKVQEIRSRYPK